MTPLVVLLDASPTQALRLSLPLEAAGCRVAVQPDAAGLERYLGEVALVAVNLGSLQDDVGDLADRLHRRRPDLVVGTYGGPPRDGEALEPLPDSSPEAQAERILALVAIGRGRALADTLQGARVLLVDDSMTFREYVRMELEADGAVVSAAATAAECLEGIADPAVEAVVLDLVMPGVDGLSLCNSLDRLRRRQGRCFPILMLTSREDPRHMLEALAAGADDFLGKSQPPEIIKARLSALLRAARRGCAQKE